MGSDIQRTRVASRVGLLRRALAVALVVLVWVLVVAPALAVQAPFGFEASPYRLEVFSTRVHLIEVLQTGQVQAGWVAEYAPGEGCPGSCHPPVAGSGSWVVTGSGKTEELGGKFEPSVEAFLGSVPSPGQTALALLHHLSPETTYYARFHGDNSNSEHAEQTFEFTTSPVAKPEVLELVADSGVSTSAFARANIESNGAETKYEFEYTPAGSEAWTPFSSDASGTVTVAEDFAAPEAKLTGLAPETSYCVRVTATNSHGTVVETKKTNGGGDVCFTTPSAKPGLGSPEVRNVSAGGARLDTSLGPKGAEAHWWFEYATAEAGPWTVVPGGEGVVSQAQAEVLAGEGRGVAVEASLSGLNPGTGYFVRAVAENAAGAATSTATSFKTFGAPLVSTFAVHGLHGEALRVMGAVNPDSRATSGEQTIALEGAPTGGTFTLTFKEHTTAPIAHDASSATLLLALEALPGVQVGVHGPNGGPWTVYFTGADAGVAEPAITGDGSELAPSGSVGVTVVVAGGEAYDTHYHFEYVSEKQFAEGGFAKPSLTPEVDLGSGEAQDYVGADLPTLEAGETYRFRLVATNTSPGNPVVHGEEQSLTVPAVTAGAAEVVGGCPNEALRGGVSASLPDCRAYEQVTPVDKEGTAEIFNYGTSVPSEATPGPDGERLEYESRAVKWGSGVEAGESPYFFSRGASGWQMTPGTVQPQAGISEYVPQVISADQRSFAWVTHYGTSPVGVVAKPEFGTGPVGGPYATVASVPNAQSQPGWVASSADFSKLVLQVEDHKLTGASTHTLEGDDLYEYQGGGLRQLNVTTAGTTIGTCGARIAASLADFKKGFSGSGAVDAAHAVSGDGSRVFFEAVPGSSCSAPEHVYERVDGGGEGAKTEDLGAYEFVAASADGSRVLLEKATGENPGLYLYDADTGTTRFLPSSGVAIGALLTVSEDLSTVYIRSVNGELKGDLDLYRYDIAAGSLLFVSHLEVDGARQFFQSSPDGRYFYFIATSVAGLPAGGVEVQTAGAAHHGQTSQVFRYDSAQQLVQCVSCASPSDPEPLVSAVFTTSGRTVASSNGDYVFFDSAAELLPADVDGQIAPEGTKAAGGIHGSSFYSLSSDVYEWRAPGVDGCAVPQGCLALITTGRGGYLNILLGTTPSGGDVFFATDESLVKADNDTASDIYDARVDGGFPEPPRPVECAGDSCAQPFSPPPDVSPASAAFQGAGNLLSSSLPTVLSKSKPKPKRKCKARTRSKRRTKCRRAHRKAKHASTQARRTR